MVWITEGEMLTARQKIKLVAEISVLIASYDKKENLEKPERKGDRNWSLPKVCRLFQNSHKLNESNFVISPDNVSNLKTFAQIITNKIFIFRRANHDHSDAHIERAEHFLFFDISDFLH